MLLSWPETVGVGVFPGHSWLQGRREAIAHSIWCAPPTSADALLRAMEEMLEQRADALRKGSHLTLLVSDSIAAITILPWQEALVRQGELEAYARICLEKQGVEIDGAWVLRAGVRNYRGLGIAYAFSRDWLTELVASINARQLRLKSVLPVSAAAYFGHNFRRGGGQTLLLLREETRTSALIFDKKGLLGRDVEPVTAFGQDSGVRLLRRIAASYGICGRVVDWSTEPAEHGKAPDFISQCLPEAKAFVLRRGVWG